MAKNEKAISGAELSNFCGQVALILEAGLPLYDGMETLVDADQGSVNSDMFRSASQGVTETGSLYEALKNDKRWPSYLVEMVGIGEQSGQLEKVMRGLEKYYSREDRMRSAIKSAITYPLSLGCMLVLIVLIMLWKVLPIFRRMLGSMGVGVGESGNVLMQIGATVGWFVLVIVGLVLIAVVVIVLLMRTPNREKVMAFLYKIFPPVQRLSRKLSASRVATVLSMMLGGGFTTDDALQMTSSVLDDKEAAARVEQIRKEMDEGKTYADAIANTGLFDELEVRMIRMGSATGHDDSVLAKVGDLYEEQVESDITRLVSIIEPTLVALLSIVIGAVLLSVMLPMAGILSSL